MSKFNVEPDATQLERLCVAMVPKSDLMNRTIFVKKVKIQPGD